MKIVLASDNHGDHDILKKVVLDNNDANYYWHLGDSEAISVENISPFASVLGNNDWNLSFPRFLIYEIGTYRFLLVHGTGLVYGTHFDDLIDLAKEKNCNVVCFGHVHRYVDQYIKGVRLLNPGSLRYNRDGNGRTYMIIEINDNNLHILKKEIDNQL